MAAEEIKPDFRNAPITAPYARDMVLEAHRLLLPHHPYAEDIIFVEIFEVPGMALHNEEGVIFYHPHIVMQIPLDNLCQILSQILHEYGMHISELHAPPPGTVLH
jgi:hypothetical protein